MAAATPPHEAERLAALHRYGILDTAPEAAFDRITRLVIRALDVPIALVSLVDAQRQWFKSCIGLAVDQLPRDGAFCTQVVLDDAALIVPDALADPRFVANPLVTGPPFVRSYIGAPLRSPAGMVLGTVCALDTRPRDFDRALVDVLADLAAITVDELELRASARTRALAERVVQTSPDILYVLDLVAGRNVWASRPMASALGYDAATRPAVQREMVHPDDLPQLNAHLASFDRIADGEHVELSYRVLDASGAYRWFLARETPFTRDAEGKVIEIVGVATDVTALKQAEAHARRTEEVLQDRVRVLEVILQTAGEAILVVDREGRYRIFNDTARRLLGRHAVDVAPADRSRVYGVFEADCTTPMALDRLPLVRALQGDVVDRETVWLKNELNPDGVYLSATARPLRDASGTIRGAVGTFADVTGLKRAEIHLAQAQDALADRVEILEAVLESAGEGIMVADADGHLIVANPFARFLIGGSPGDAGFPSERWTRDVGFYRPDATTIVPLDEFPLTRAIRGEPTYGAELYVRNERLPDGRYLQITGRGIRDGKGRPRGGVIVLSDITLLKHTQEQVTALALVDELTGLANRRAFRERLDLLTAESARGRSFALTLIDIDHFKRINDVHGHDVGDQVLVAVARTLQRHVRASDLVARIGGEEFCVLQADVGAEATELAERLRVAIQSIDGPVSVTASFGVSHAGLLPADLMLKGADQALYRAKRAGRNRVVLAEAGDVELASVLPPA